MEETNSHFVVSLIKYPDIAADSRVKYVEFFWLQLLRPSHHMYYLKGLKKSNLNLRTKNTHVEAL